MQTTTGDAERMLRDKIEELQQVIREGNEERAQLRRQLKKATTTDAGGGQKVAPGDSTDDLDVGHGTGPAPPRGVLALRLEPRLLRHVPTPIAAETVRTVGELAAGDTSAWHQVKQARDMRRPLLFTRIGLRHRLLFRVED